MHLLEYTVKRLSRPSGDGAPARMNIRANVATDFNPAPSTPRVASTAFVDDGASVIGSVELGDRVFVGPGAFVRGDEGQHVHIGNDSNVQDCAGIHALETMEGRTDVWETIAGRAYSAQGELDAETAHGDVGAMLALRDRRYAVFIGERVSIAHQALVHGPAWIGDDTFVGMQAQVFQAKVGARCVILPKALVMGVTVAPGRLVPAGANVTTQAAADALGPAAGSGYERLDEAVVHVNTGLAEGYARQRQRGR